MHCAKSGVPDYLAVHRKQSVVTYEPDWTRMDMPQNSMIHMKFERILQDPSHTSSIDNEYYRYLKHVALIHFDHGERTKHRSIIQPSFV